MTSLSRIWTIATNTLREAVRNKVLYTLLLFTVAFIGLGILLSTLSYVEKGRILQDIGIASIRLFGVAIAIFVGVGLIHKEVDRRTVFTILSKPLSRGEFLLGKFLGLLLTLWLQMAIMIATFAAVSLLAGAPLDGGYAAAFLLTGVELALIVAVATFFSSFTSPLLATLFTSGVWAVGHLTRDLRDLGARSDAVAVQQLTAILHRALPDLESFNLSIEAVHGLTVTASDVWLPLLYGSGYVVLLLISAVALFERRDFR